MNEDKGISVVTAYTNIPYSVFATEIAGSLKNDFNNAMNEIMGFYEVYEKGAEFSTEGTGGDYVASSIKYKKIRDLIDKESRFLFSIPPTFTVNQNVSGMNDKEKAANTQLNLFLTDVLNKTKFNSNLVRAAKDCFIAKRIP